MVNIPGSFRRNKTIQTNVPFLSDNDNDTVQAKPNVKKSIIKPRHRDGHCLV